MLKLMIVEDEDRIRIGIEKILSSFEGGVSVIGSHRNGLDASLQISDLKPGELDVLITDIEMPVMNGLKLIEHAKAKMPDLSVIVLSGYDDFEYARQALRFGVEDYLLKPMDKAEAFQLLRRIQERRAIRDGREQPEPEKTQPPRSVDLLVKQLLDKEYHLPFDLTRISEQIGFSPSYTSRMFKQLTDLTITEYLNRLRIEKAKQFLKDHPHLKVYEVAHLVGFQDQMYFQKMFKKLCGMTPKQYKEQG